MRRSKMGNSIIADDSDRCITEDNRNKEAEALPERIIVSVQ